jgi:hypothetical protein
MKIFNLRDHYQDRYREFIVGSKETGRHTVYLVYGEVPGGETRALAPGGHDEILLLLSGEAVLEDSGPAVPLSGEQVVALESHEVVTFRASTDCRYVVAGTHTTPHQH